MVFTMYDRNGQWGPRWIMCAPLFGQQLAEFSDRFLSDYRAAKAWAGGEGEGKGGGDDRYCARAHEASHGKADDADDQNQKGQLPRSSQPSVRRSLAPGAASTNV